MKNFSILQTFGSNIRSLRRAQNMSQEDLADRSGLDRSYLGSVERGERNISLINILKIANALGISAKELFNDV
ncbi:helix-turn-helix domain-containing protein [Pseudidiomarina marina]|uniref:XRE family transcriptional regulator n=1 Tax=Pseudidiomarina marina TaxID=502366 RepID=A0A432YCL7_9GAMM|nr:helix-turn-helix transcriptional regulator [Pseudidiomarina marina]RUO58671.1 XRE family transcriptional regulator [Pseudidiomarina marina]